MELVIKAKKRYVVAIDKKPYQVDEQKQWCEETYGRAGSRHGKQRRWRLGWTDNRTFFHFRNEKDATWCMMKWT